MHQLSHHKRLLLLTMGDVDIPRTYAEDCPELEVELYPSGSESSFHTQNDPNQPFEREDVIQRKGRVYISCEIKDVAHGYFSEDSEDLCSLIVIECRFEPNGIARRIKQADVNIRFSSMKMGRPDPEVFALQPEGGFSLEPTRQEEEISTSGALKVGSNGGGVQLGVELERAKAVKRDTFDVARLSGKRDRKGRNWGPKNAAAWTLLENPTAKSGVASNLRGAILVKRSDMEHFKATVTIEAKTDLVTSLESLFKSTPKDDDVWFDPTRLPTARLQEYDTQNLGAVDLRLLSRVTSKTFLLNTVKTE